MGAQALRPSKSIKRTTVGLSRTKVPGHAVDAVRKRTRRPNRPRRFRSTSPSRRLVQSKGFELRIGHRGRDTRSQDEILRLQGGATEILSRSPRSAENSDDPVARCSTMSDRDKSRPRFHSHVLSQRRREPLRDGERMEETIHQSGRQRASARRSSVARSVSLRRR